MGQGFATDLLRDFNEGRVRELLNQCGNVGRVIVLGPPSSGKSFFINNYVRTHCPNAEVLEYVAGLVEEAPVGGGRESMLRRIIDWFNRSSGSEDLNKLASELGLSNYSVNELRRVFGDKVPKDLAEQLRGLKKRGLLDSALITYYYVPSDLGIDTIKRINDILRDEGVKFSWLGREYVPPALIRLVGEYGEGELRRQLRLYREVSERLSVGDDIANWISGHLREFVEKVLWVASYIVPTPLDAVLAIVASSISWGGENPLHALLGVINDWNNLNEGLRSVIMHNLAHRLGIDINVIRKLFNTLSGVDHRKLEELSNVIGELTLKVELMGRSGGRIEVFTRGDMARGVLDVFKRDNEYMLNYGTGTVKLATTSGYEGLVSGLIDEFMRSNVVVLVGPRGIGKTVLGSYTAVKMLEDGKVSYIIRVRDLTNEDYMKLHYLWVRAFLSDSLIVYDPSPITTYMEGEEPEEITGISQNIEWLIELSKLKVRLLLILPSDLYESLTDEVKAELSSHIISQEEISKALRNEEFLTAVIKAYSGCSDEAALRSLASEVLKFNEGYTLIARLVGEELRRSNCLVSDAQAMLRKTRGDASALLIHWINGYLGIFERGKPIPNRIKALAEVLAVREPFKADLSPGDYIVTPLLVKRLVEWASNGSMGLSDEKANWLAVRHEDLLEDAITRIVKTAMGEEADGSEYLKQALEPWSKYGRLKGKVNDIEDAVEYINERYGKELGEEFKNISSDCWNAIVLALGTAWADYPLRAIIENIKKPGDVTDLMPIVNSAIQYITNPNLENNGNASCDAVRLLIINNEIPPLTKGLLYTLLVLDTLAEGKIDYIRNALNEFIKEIEDVRRRNRGLYFIEVIYVHGLAVLTVHAVKRAIREYMSDDELKARALETAGWAIWSIGDPSLIIAVVNLMSSLSNSSLNDWAVILAAATSALIDNENELSELSEFIDDLWAKRNGLSDWGGKAYLINAMVDTLRTKENAEQICEIFKKEILNAINGIGSDPLRVLSKAHAYSRLAIFEVDCGISLEQEIVKLIKTLENADQAAWLRDEQFVEYLRHYSLEKPEDALRRLINEYLSGLYHAMGKLSVDNADLDNALKYFEKAMNINKGFGLWFNYIVSYNTLVRARVLKAGNINEFIDVSREFGDVFNEALKRFSPTVAGLTVLASSLLAEYLVYLAIVGDKARFTELMRSRDWLLQYLPPDVKTVTVLLLKWLGADVEVPNAEELINAMMIDLNPEFLPALRRVLGIGVDCGEECGELGNPNDVEMCNTACAAAGGNKYALKKLMEYVRREFKPLTSALANFSPRAIVQALALMHTLGMLALILNALLSKDYESAKAIVTVSEYLLSKSIGKELFGDLRRAIDEGDVDGIKLALAKLYYLWI